MSRLRGFRARLVATMILLVAVSIAIVGAGTYLLVSNSLRSQLIDDAVDRAAFNVGVLADETQLPPGAGAAELAAGSLPTAFLVGGSTGVYVDFGDGKAPYASSTLLLDTPLLVSGELTDLVESGTIAYQFVRLGGGRSLVVAGRRPPAGPDFYFFSSAASLDAALSRLRQVLVAGGAALTLLGVVVAFLTARRVLRPVATASAAARRVAGGDLAVRIPVESDDEFGSWAESFNVMAASLQAKVAELEAAQAREQRFTADVSHELRTPVTALVNEAALLRDHLDALPDEGRQVGELLVADVGRLRRLVEDLLEISRLDAAAAEATEGVLDLEPFLAAVIASRHPQATLEVADPAVLSVDRRALERIIGNLLDNARDHAPDAPVEVRAAAAAGALTVTVADRGPAVPAGDLGMLFDRFYKADTARGGEGSGLGLAIARQHAERLGGTLGAELRDGGGLLFRLSLPVTGLLPDRDAAANPLPQTGDNESAERA